MRRREVITLCSAAAMWPLVVHAQSAMPVIGYPSRRARARTVLSFNIAASIAVGVALACALRLTHAAATLRDANWRPVIVSGANSPMNPHCAMRI